MHLSNPSPSPSPTSSSSRRDQEEEEEEDIDPRVGVTRCTVDIPEQVVIRRGGGGGGGGVELGRRVGVGVGEDEEGGRDLGELEGEFGIRTKPKTRIRTRSLWSTKEFKFYYLVYLVGLPLLCWIPIRLSRCEFLKNLIFLIIHHLHRRRR